MNGIGGFLPLDTGGGTGPYHHDAAALASGRSCWHAILRHTRPTRVLVPFYVCDAVLWPLIATKTPFEFYAIDDRFRPARDHRTIDGELLLMVNYFGLLTPLMNEAAQSNRRHVVVDDTQAFFRRGSSTQWSFNSARKFFGVPDGAYLYGPAAADLNHLPPSEIGDCDHLVARQEDGEGAWTLFRQHEARIGIELQAMSATSTRLLAAVDAAASQRSRRENFAVLHRLLGVRNTIAAPLDCAAANEGPMCYPFLPDRSVDRAELASRGVFVPMLWPEVEQRSNSGFEWERHIARRLLPLPIDHRYGAADMETVAHTLLQVVS